MLNALKMFAGRSIDAAMCVHMTCKREWLGKPRSHCDVRAAKMWNRLPREVVLAPSWGFCPTRLDKTQNSLV